MKNPRLPISLTASLLATAALLSACGTSGGPAPAAPSTGTALERPANYTLVWSDEFSTNGLPDPTKWDDDTSANKTGWYNHELQYYARQRPENAQVQDGLLRITARKESLSNLPDWGGQAYTSARLVTRGKADWTYGFFEVRAKLPCGKGTWPAIWTLGSKGQWPADGELDLMEQVGSDPTRVLSTVHRSAGFGANGSSSSFQVADACTAFHNYQMLWTPEAVKFGTDGQLKHTYANPHTGYDAWPFDNPQYMILNLAIGGDMGGAVDDSIFPVTMEVDYVRVWQAPK